jgi:hypothetical protein
MVLKVGKVGPNSDARFRSQHYTTSERSILGQEPSGTPDGALVVLASLEMYVRAWIGSVFKGSA